jgi:hypothetical protein
MKLWYDRVEELVSQVANHVALSELYLTMLEVAASKQETSILEDL